jgi:hypothetical protein
MQTNASSPVLSEGQVWKTDAANIEIVALGKELIHYRVTHELGRKRVSSQISGIAPMEQYLKDNAARLVQPSSRN